MRIVGGKFRGRHLQSPKSNLIRPTTDRTRESLFNILQSRYRDHLQDCRMLELFAGTGAVGLEALSRGASYVLFVEKGAEGRAVLRTNVDQLSLHGCTRIFKRDATKLGPIGKMVPFDLVFADPPYGKTLGEQALKEAANQGWLSYDALVILEEQAAVEPDLTPSFDLQDCRAFGDTKMWFYVYKGEDHGG